MLLKDVQAQNREAWVLETQAFSKLWSFKEGNEEFESENSIRVMLKDVQAQNLSALMFCLSRKDMSFRIFDH